jgi:hypothetical protein
MTATPIAPAALPPPLLAGEGWGGVERVPGNRVEGQLKHRLQKKRVHRKDLPHPNPPL